MPRGHMGSWQVSQDGEPREKRKGFLVMGIVFTLAVFGFIAMAIVGFTGGSPWDNDLFFMGPVGMFGTIISLFLSFVGYGMYHHSGSDYMNTHTVQFMDDGFHSFGNVQTNSINSKNIEQELKKIDDLLAKGLITHNEYTKMRNSVLGLEN